MRTRTLRLDDVDLYVSTKDTHDGFGEQAATTMNPMYNQHTYEQAVAKNPDYVYAHVPENASTPKEPAESASKVQSMKRAVRQLQVGLFAVGIVAFVSIVL